MANTGRFRRDARDMDAEEELWFGNDDDCDEVNTNIFFVIGFFSITDRVSSLSYFIHP